jgi:hypothetical protein
MTHQPATAPHGCDLCLRHGARPPLARRRRRARLPSAAWLDGPRRPDRSASPHGPRLAARRGGSSKPRNNEHRPQAVPPWGRWSNSGRGGGRARFHCSAKRPIAAFGRRRWGHAQGRSCAKSTKPASVAAHAANDSTEPRRNGRGWCGYAPACCGRLHESVPSSTLAVRCLYVTKDGSPTRRPASLLWSFHTTPQYVAVSCGRGALALSSGH